MGIAFLKMFAAIATLFLAVPLRGYVLSTLWSWFLVPLHVGAIGIAHAIGIIVLVQLFLSRLKSEDSNTEKGLGYNIILALVTPLIFLIFGYVAHWVMV